MKKLRAYEERERESQLNLQGEMKNRYSEMVNEVGRLRTKVSSGLFGVFLVVVVFLLKPVLFFPYTSFHVVDFFFFLAVFWN